MSADEHRHQWLDEGRGWDHGNDIAGHSTQFEQVYWVLYHRVRASFPINEVPPDVADRLVNLHAVTIAAEATMRALIDRVSDLRQAPEVRP